VQPPHGATARQDIVGRESNGGPGAATCLLPWTRLRSRAARPPDRRDGRRGADREDGLAAPTTSWSPDWLPRDRAAHALRIRRALPRGEPHRSQYHPAHPATARGRRSRRLPLPREPGLRTWGDGPDDFTDNEIDKVSSAQLFASWTQHELLGASCASTCTSGA
jgi:hypothetical protein